MNDSATSATFSPALDAVEIRLLGVLAEKEMNTPDTYPLSINALTSGCNQLSSRDPVVRLTDAEVEDGLQRLIQKKLVSLISSARVAKYEHRMRLAWTLEQDKLAVMAVLMLRGPQTAGEIRARVGKLHAFAALTEVEAALEFLLDKFPPLVARLPRAPGSKETRYAHLLDGSTAAQAAVVPTRAMPDSDRLSELNEQMATLREDLDELRTQFAEFKKLLE